MILGQYAVEKSDEKRSNENAQRLALLSESCLCHIVTERMQQTTNSGERNGRAQRALGNNSNETRRMERQRFGSRRVQQNGRNRIATRSRFGQPISRWLGLNKALAIDGYRGEEEE